MSKKGKNGANKKLHSKLIQQKKDKERESKARRKRMMREMNQKANKKNQDN